MELWQSTVEGLGLGMFSDAFLNQRVFITGHTGFKGSWLTYWLLRKGAEVTGFSLPEAPTNPSLFEQLELRERIGHRVGDVRDSKFLSDTIQDVQPRFVFHLAAQPLVRRSYDEPRETFEVNVQGTVNVLDAVRNLERPCFALIVTTDKCYENQEWLSAYRETDPMGGYDPYSASKGCAELVTAAYRNSYSGATKQLAIASARAGNVIGGGDWATDRIVPDCLRSIGRGDSVPVRNKHATRPWQHVLEPLSGYLALAVSTAAAQDSLDEPRIKQLSSSYNFGPELDSNRTVAELVSELTKHLSGKWHDASELDAPHEASRLNLAIDKAWHSLGWRPTWNFRETVEKIADWYRRTRDGDSEVEVIADQIDEFEQLLYADQKRIQGGKTSK